MALEKQIVPVPLAQGVDTKDDPKQVPIGKLLTLENGFFQTPGEIRKRYGFSALGTNVWSGGSIGATANGLFSYNDGMVQTSGGLLYSYTPTADKWTSVGAYTPSKITIGQASVSNIATNATEKYQDGAYDSVTDTQCFVFIIGSSAYYTVVGRTTGQVIVRGTLIGTATFVKVLLFQSNFVFVYDDTAGNLKYNRVTTSAPGTLVGATTLATDINVANPNFDITVISTKIFIGYNYVTTGISLMTLSSSFVASAELHNTTNAATGAIGIWGDTSNNVWVAYSNNTNVYGVVYDFSLSASPVSALVTIGAIANVNQVTGINVSGTGTVLFSVYTNHSINNLTYATSFTIGGGGSTASIWQRSISLASKQFIYAFEVYVLCQFGGSTTGQPTLFLYKRNPSGSIAKAGLIGKLAAGVAYDSPRVVLPEVSTISTGLFQIPFAQNAGENEIPIWGSSWCAFVDMTVSPQSAQIANELHLTGGQLWMYDGSYIVEHGFHLYPDIISATPSGAGVLAASSSYEYIAVYEYIDNNGLLHRSAPSLPFTITTGGTGAASVAVVVSTLRVTNKLLAGCTPQIVLYRTAANGTIFYVTSAPVGNDITADTITVTDVSPDTTLVGNVELYTTGGQAENSSAPPCLAITTYKSRLVVVPSDNPYSWWFSQEVIPNSASSSATPVELSALFIQNIDQSGGPLTGVSVIDDKLILMKKDSPYYLAGNGPAPNGTNNDYTPPQAITSPVGSVNASSIVRTPFGLMFQAANSAGLWMLDRSLTASYLGADVEIYNSQTVVSATAYPAYNQIRFAMSGGVCLVFDYYVKQWSVYTGISAIQACLFQGTYAYNVSSGQVYKESTSTFTDNGTFVQLKLDTSWMQFAGLQGFQRVYEALILGDYESAHTLNAKVYYDFDSTSAAQTTAITPTSTPPYQWRLLFNRQKCEAIKIELYDSQVSPAEGMRLSAISLKVGVKGGLNRMPAARTFE